MYRVLEAFNATLIFTFNNNTTCQHLITFQHTGTARANRIGFYQENRYFRIPIANGSPALRRMPARKPLRASLMGHAEWVRLAAQMAFSATTKWRRNDAMFAVRPANNSEDLLGDVTPGEEYLWRSVTWNSRHVRDVGKQRRETKGRRHLCGTFMQSNDPLKRQLIVDFANSGSRNKTAAKAKLHLRLSLSCSGRWVVREPMKLNTSIKHHKSGYHKL